MRHVLGFVLALCCLGLLSAAPVHAEPRTTVVTLKREQSLELNNLALLIENTRLKYEAQMNAAVAPLLQKQSELAGHLGVKIPKNAVLSLNQERNELTISLNDDTPTTAPPKIEVAKAAKK